MTRLYFLWPVFILAPVTQLVEWNIEVILVVGSNLTMGNIGNEGL